LDWLGLSGAPAPYGSKREIRMVDRTYVQAREVARTLGIKTGTLGKWRRQGRGPKGWVRLGRTSVAMPPGVRPHGNRAGPSDRPSQHGILANVIG
jgi:hypothetical protein